MILVVLDLDKDILGDTADRLWPEEILYKSYQKNGSGLSLAFFVEMIWKE